MLYWLFVRQNVIDFSKDSVAHIATSLLGNLPYYMFIHLIPFDPSINIGHILNTALPLIDLFLSSQHVGTGGASSKLILCHVSFPMILWSIYMTILTLYALSRTPIPKFPYKFLNGYVMNAQHRTLLPWPSISVVVCLFLSIACWTAVSFYLINRSAHENRVVEEGELLDNEGLEKLLQDLEEHIN